ncbi:MAG TPA: VTT domain-containing protein [Thermoanaerobaculia bacterium]|nr:VTT domain-containing protein [Thermoanaerobaculia bacterium]
MTLSSHPRRRVVALALMIALAIGISMSDFATEQIQPALGLTRTVMVEHPRLGKTLFVLLSAVSAMVAFFSSAIIVPVAVYAWGDRTTFFLLWIAWLLGGTCSFAIGRTLGRGVFTWLVDRERFDYYAGRISRNAHFLTVLLFQLALPSEIPGYVLGAVGYRFRTFLAVLALAELPFALGAVYLGDTFVNRRWVMFAIVGVTGLAITALALWRLQHEMKRSDDRIAGLRGGER